MDNRTDKRRFIQIDLDVMQLERLEEAERSRRDAVSFLLQNQAAFALVNEHNFDPVVGVKSSVELPFVAAGPPVGKI